MDDHGPVTVVTPAVSYSACAISKAVDTPPRWFLVLVRHADRHDTWYRPPLSAQRCPLIMAASADIRHRPETVCVGV